MLPTALDETSPTPLYHQLFSILRDKIRRGELRGNSPLPGEIQLSELFGVSRITVKRALTDLAAEGLVRRRRGLGTFVSSIAAPPPVVNGSFATWIESVDALDRDIQTELVEVADLAAEQLIADALDLEPDTRVQRITRVRRASSLPFAHVVAYVPATIAAGYSPSDLANNSMLALLEKAGASPSETEQWISATLAPSAIAPLLAMSPTEPVLKLEQVIRDRSRRPIQFLRVHYHAERFQYHLKMQRKRSRKSSAPPATKN